MPGASYKAECLVLKKTKLGETDLILTMLDSTGHQVRGVAKGARKPGNRRFGARLEPYSHVNVVLYPGRSLESITEVQVVNSNAACREDLDKSSACSLMAELVDKATRDGEVGERVFACLQAAFAAVGPSSSDRALTLAVAFVVKACAMTGFRPALRECALCGGEVGKDDVFDLHAGGMLCQNCAGGIGGDVDGSVVSWIDLLLGSTFAVVAEAENAPDSELLTFAEMWVREHLGLHLKTAGFIRSQL